MPKLGPTDFAQNTLDSGHPTSDSSCTYGSRDSPVVLKMA